jgi:hypothetical protein
VDSANCRRFPSTKAAAAAYWRERGRGGMGGGASKSSNVLTEKQIQKYVKDTVFVCARVLDAYVHTGTHPISQT